MRNILIILGIQLALCSALNAADSTIVSFSVGNSYAFVGSQYCHGVLAPTTLSYTETIVSDIVINSRQYFVFQKSARFSSIYFPIDSGIVLYRRSDSTSIYQYNISLAKEDTLVDFSDSVGTKYSSGLSLGSKEDYPLFGAYYSTVDLGGGTCWISSKFFLTRYFSPGICETQFYLKAAKIDGTIFGDSTLVSVMQANGNRLNTSQFVLFQNYPNPFNPITQIKFFVSQRTYATLKVYDLLGREIALLADQVVNIGYHSVSFDGSNTPSGIYFYRLQTASSTLIKRLVLLK